MIIVISCFYYPLYNYPTPGCQEAALARSASQHSGASFPLANSVQTGNPAYRFYPDRAKQLGLEQPQDEFALNDEVARYAFVTQCLDSLDICQFVFGAGWQLYNPDQLVETVRAITGWKVSIEELLKGGEKRINLM